MVPLGRRAKRKILSERSNCLWSVVSMLSTYNIGGFSSPPPKEAALTAYARLCKDGAIILLSMFNRIVTHAVYVGCLRSALALSMTNTLEVVLQSQARQSCSGRRHCPNQRTIRDDSFTRKPPVAFFIQRRDYLGICSSKSALEDHPDPNYRTKEWRAYI